MHDLLKRLLDARNQAVAESRTVINEAEVAKRDLTSEENEKVDRALAAAAELDSRIATVRKAIEGDAAAEEARALLPGDPTPKPSADPTPRSDEDPAKAIRSFLRGEGARSFSVSGERRDLTKGTAAAGGNTVPTSFLARLYEHLIENSAIRQTNVTVLTTNSGEALQIPKTATFSSGAIVAEAGAIPESDPTFGQLTLDAFKYGVMVQVSRELIEDTAVDLLGFVAMQAGRALANASGAHYITGTGASQPNGVVTASTLGKTAASNAAVTADELIDLYFSVIAPYRAKATWLMRDATMASIRKLKDTTNQYLWQPGLVSGTPDTILGRPLLTDPNVAAIGTTAKSVVFGDMSAYYIRDVNAVRFERSDDFAFGNDLVSFRALLRTDGDLVDTTGAVKHLAHPV